MLMTSYIFEVLFQARVLFCGVPVRRRSEVGRLSSCFVGILLESGRVFHRV